MSKLSLVSLFVAFGLSGTAMADQCGYIAKQQAIDAAKFLSIGTTFGKLCEPCGETALATEEVLGVSAGPAEYEDLWVVRINGVEVDLAYIYLKTGQETFTNLAQMVGCPVHDVTGFVKVN